MFFDLPRLSEDLDLDFIRKDAFSLNDFGVDIRKYFFETLQYRSLKVKVSGRENIIYLKFPVLDQIGLKESESKTNLLFLRIDLDLTVLRQDLLPLFKEKNFVENFCKNYQNVANVLINRHL